MKEMGDQWNYFIRKSEEKESLGVLDIDGRIIQKE
jgi:hypothetical protein